ncbi:hypothetical protein BASA81_014536 [Batrachochytrium salamandrivorans]|nr:hypothetical protein BASA81_014536 [Batrachochytrium salamandrivorans]
MNCDKDSLEFVISRPAIVDRVVMNLFFHPEEDKESEDTEPITKANAMKLFQLQEDGSYVVVIKNSLRFDLRIRVCVHGVLYNLHLVLVPFFGRHTAQNYVKLIKVLLDSLSPIWRDKVISISSMERIMTGRHGGVVTLLEQECLNPPSHLVCPAPAGHCGQERDAWCVRRVVP